MRSSEPTPVSAEVASSLRLRAGHLARCRGVRILTSPVRAIGCSRADCRSRPLRGKPVRRCPFSSAYRDQWPLRLSVDGRDRLRPRCPTLQAAEHWSAAYQPSYPIALHPVTQASAARESGGWFDRSRGWTWRVLSMWAVAVRVIEFPASAMNSWHSAWMTLVFARTYSAWQPMGCHWNYPSRHPWHSGHTQPHIPASRRRTR